MPLSTAQTTATMIGVSGRRREEAGVEDMRRSLAVIKIQGSSIKFQARFKS
jgi:hypothetical protein